MCEVNKDTLTVEESEVANGLVYQRFAYTIVRYVQRVKKKAYDRHHGTEDRYLSKQRSLAHFYTLVVIVLRIAS